MSFYRSKYIRKKNFITFLNSDNMCVNSHFVSMYDICCKSRNKNLKTSIGHNSLYKVSCRPLSTFYLLNVSKWKQAYSWAQANASLHQQHIHAVSSNFVSKFWLWPKKWGFITFSFVFLIFNILMSYSIYEYFRTVSSHPEITNIVCILILSQERKFSFYFSVVN